MNKRLRKKKGLAKIQDSELWGLDVTLAKYILPRLERFKEINKMSHPIAFGSIEEWHEVIDKMVYSFDYVLKEDSGIGFDLLNEEERECRYKKYQEGMDLFAKHFMDLWD